MITLLLSLHLSVLADAGSAPVTVWVRTRDGRDLEGTAEGRLAVEGKNSPNYTVDLADLRSFQSAAAASAFETERITADLAELGSGDVATADRASTELADIGLPVITPLLQSYQDVDAHEPDPRYRLFGRIVPGHLDGQDRTLDLVRPKQGPAFRARAKLQDLELHLADGTVTTVTGEDVRRIAVLQDVVERHFDLQALHDCTYVGFVDTGIAVREGSKLRADCQGYVRLSFDEDGWATDPDGIFDPLPGKRKLQEGFRWGSVLGRVGCDGERFFVGKHLDKEDLGAGHLFFVINDNEHWQNNIGSYRVMLRVEKAYDLGEAH